MTEFKNINDIEKKIKITIKIPSKYNENLLQIFNSDANSNTNTNTNTIELIKYDLTNPIILFIIGLYYQHVKKNNSEMVIYYKKSAELGNIAASYNLAIYYHYTDCHYKEATKHYLIILNSPKTPLILRIKTMFNLGFFQQKIDKNYLMMKKYYFELLDLINNSDDIMRLTTTSTNTNQNQSTPTNDPYIYASMKKIKSATTFNLGHYYQYIEPNYILMKRYYSIAINLFNSKAANNLSLYYQNIEYNHLLMEKYYIKGIQLGNHKSLINLELYYKYKNQSDMFYNKLKKMEPNKIITDRLNKIDNSS